MSVITTLLTHKRKFQVEQWTMYGKQILGATTQSYKDAIAFVKQEQKSTINNCNIFARKKYLCENIYKHLWEAHSFDTHPIRILNMVKY